MASIPQAEMEVAANEQTGEETTDDGCVRWWAWWSK